MLMKRLTVFDGEFWLHKDFPPVREDTVDEFVDCVKDMASRLASIENILGDEYDLDRLKELVEADRNHLLKEQKTQTNADKIRSMTDEELAVFLDEFSGRCMDCEKLGPDTGCPIYKGGVFCLPCDVMDWLKQPAKED